MVHSPHAQSLSAVAEELIRAARDAGADAADALAVDATALSIEVRAGRLEHAERSEGVEAGLRVIVGRRQATVAASDVRPATLAEMAARAVQMARLAPEDPTVGLADPDRLARDTDAGPLDLYDPADDPDPATLEDLARRAEAAALAVSGVAQVIGAGASRSRRRLHLAATNGFSAGYSRSDAALSCTALTGEGTGMERDWAHEARIRLGDLPDPEAIGRLAGERAVARTGPRRPKTGAFPVLFDERVSSSLIGHLLAAVQGSAVARGSSWLMDALGTPVLPAGLTLTEDPRRRGGFMSRPFDAEGLPTAARDIVRDGVLTGWTLDLATARKLGMDSTANAVRSPGGAPSPGVTNLDLTPGTATRDDLIAEMGTGLLVTSLIGSTISPTTGDYSRGANGFWVENGRIGAPVNECTIAGNLREMLMTLRPANDARAHLSRRIPSLLVEGLTIAGD